jgi:outer membrane protein, heavy metal efflux system
VPLPVFNTRRGEIEQRAAERAKVGAEVYQTEVQIRQEVFAALGRLEQARAGVELYRKEIRPSLEAALKDIKQLFDRGEPGVDALRVLDVQRKLLKARDGELDVLWELRQAQSDLAAATGNPALTFTSSRAP